MELLVYLARFVASDLPALGRLGTTCRDMREAVDPLVKRLRAEQHATLASSREVGSLQSLRVLLEEGTTAPTFFKQRPLRAALFATLASRIAALPMSEQREARDLLTKAMIAGLDPVEKAPVGASLEAGNLLTKTMIAGLDPVEKAAVESSIGACRNCENLAAVMELAGERGVISSAGLAEMKFAAACAARSRGMSWRQARDSFGIPADDLHRYRAREYEISHTPLECPTVHFDWQ
jgi:hypothetical protein